MAAKFPSQEWMDNLKHVLNTDPDYARIARNWEGDLAVVLEPGGTLTEHTVLYWDLWHGTCRDARMIPTLEGLTPLFILTGSFEDVLKILRGKLDPMQAMLIRKLHVHGSMPYMMRNVPTVLDFVRCARLATTEIDL